MTANIPVLPVAGGALVRAFLSLLAFVTRLLKPRAGPPPPPRGDGARRPRPEHPCRYRHQSGRSAATPFPRRSGKTRPRCCASASSSGAQPERARPSRARLPPPAHEPPVAPGLLKIHRNGRTLSSAAIRNREYPLSRLGSSARRPLRRAHSLSGNARFLGRRLGRCANMSPGTASIERTRMRFLVNVFSALAVLPRGHRVRPARL